MVENDIAGRVVIVTGGGAGIGRGIAQHLARSGAHVVISGRRAEVLEEVTTQWRAEGLSCLAVPCDVRDRSAVDAMVATAHEEFGRIDGLVNNAMTMKFGLIADITPEDLEMNLDSGFNGTLWAMQAVYPHMKRAGWGRIVNVGSSGSIIGYKGMAAYNATKAAIRSLTVTAAREWFADGIVVNLHHPVSIAQTTPPPDVDPDSVDERLIDPNVQETIAIALALRPTSYYGDPESDLGPVIRFLLSDECRYLTGQALTLDGGSFAFS